MYKYILITMLLVNFFNTAQSASLIEGNNVYQRECAMCHGVNGMSSMAGAPDFNRGQRLMKPDASLVEHLKNGKNACPSFLGILRENQMYDVVAYIRTLYL